MNTTVETLIHLGKDLTQEELHVINAHRKLEFNSASDIAPNPDNENWEKIFVLIKLENDLVAFGRLHDIEVKFKSKIYDVFGIATIVAVRKGHGYGTMVMKAIEQYVIKSGKTAIGFCTPNVSDFYRKCGYGIIKDGMQRFVFIDNGQRAKIERPDDYALYLPGKDDFIDQLQRHPKEKMTAYRNPW